MRDCFGTGGAGCISCQKWFPFEELHGGHFIPAGNWSLLRFDESNIHGQCSKCNTYLHANLHNYYINLVKKIGLERVDLLMNRQHETKSWTQEELKEIRQYYRKKINDIERGIDPRISTTDGLAMSEMFSDISEPGGMPDVWEREERDLSQADG